MKAQPEIITEPLDVHHLDGEMVLQGGPRLKGSLTPGAAIVTAQRLLVAAEALRGSTEHHVSHDR